ncbi:MAG: mechanosensitive ion channel family protein [Candidatus Pacebacteria bacterium]|nr:mechanosensitive ion channel family protein [Candidatus Paceibacterota bacterium]
MQQLTTYTQKILELLHLNSDYVILGNTVGAYMFAGVLFLLSLTIFALAQFFLMSWLVSLSERTKTNLDDAFVKIVQSFRPPFYLFLSFWFATKYLTIQGIASEVVTGILVVWLVYQATIVVGVLVEDVIFRHFAKDRDEATKSALHMLANLAKGVMWIVGILLVLSNFGVNVTSLMAGAGIAGIAIAFALQGILGDLFSSFSLYFDKPFKVGDFIVVDDLIGTVKHIGIKSTRIIALSGEMVTVRNQDLTASRIRNFKLMQERRVVSTFGVLYQTPIHKVRAIPEWVKGIIEGTECVRFDRAHLKEFGDSSLDFEIVYYVLDSDYTRYMDIQQMIHLALMERFQQEEVRFAYPTRTIYMAESS